MKLSERWKAYRRIVEVPSPSDKLGDEMADLLDECERALAPFGKFADELVYEDGENDDDFPNELWAVTDGELKAVQVVLKKLRGQEKAD